MPDLHIRQTIIDFFKPFDPELILLFGSQARGDADPYSDYDVIIVYNTPKRFMDRLEELYLAWDLPRAVDILAYTPEEFQDMLAWNAFVQDALETGEVLYEAQRG